MDDRTHLAQLQPLLVLHARRIGELAEMLEHTMQRGALLEKQVYMLESQVLLLRVPRETLNEHPTDAG